MELLNQVEWLLQILFVPTVETRKIFGADFTVWMDTPKESVYEDTNLYLNPLRGTM